jgi:tRNA pseudouridine55 synthase
MDGLLLVDKEAGKTSHDVVDQVRRRLGTSHVGHAGTLDPLATGLLVLGVGRALRLLEYLQGHDKEYLVGVRLGVRTDTDDADGTPVAEGPVPDRPALEAALRALTGPILQRPPAYSAVKVGGRRLYQLARAGRPAEAPPREVRVDALELLAYEPPLARLRVRGSKGLYVRAIARDLGGHVVELRRTRSGPFRVEDAGPELLPLEAAVTALPERRLTPEEALDFVNGKTVAGALEADEVRVTEAGRFLGIGRRVEGGMRARKVLARQPATGSGQPGAGSE